MTAGARPVGYWRELYDEPMSRLLKKDCHDGRDRCAVPITVADLCHDKSCNCDTPALSDPGLDFGLWVAYVDAGEDMGAETTYTDGDGNEQTATYAEALADVYGPELLAELISVQDAIYEAWDEVTERTCNRFRAGECLIVRLCPPFCPPCPPCSSCRIPWHVDISDVLCFVDLKEVTSAEWIIFSGDGAGGTVAGGASIDLPGALPRPYSQWQIKADGDRCITLEPMRLSKNDDLPTLPEQDASLAFGRPCTSAIIFRVRDDIPPLVKRAAVELAEAYVSDRDCTRCGKVDETVTAQTNDGIAQTFRPVDDDAPVARLDSVKLMETIYGCRRAAEVWHPDTAESPIVDMRWVCCEDLEDFLGERV